MVLRGNWNYPTDVRIGAGRIAELPDVVKSCAIQRPLVPIREEGRLLLSAVDVALTLEATTPVEAAELIGTEWLLDTLIEGQTATSVGGEPATLLLTADGEIIGSTGCRTLTGEYVINADVVFFTTFGADGECPGELRDQDALIVEVLGDGFTTSIEDDRLTVTSAGGLGLGYRAG